MVGHFETPRACQDRSLGGRLDGTTSDLTAAMTTKVSNSSVTILQTSRVMWLLFGAPFPVIALLCAIEGVALERARGLLYPAIILGLISAVHLSWLKLRGSPWMIRPSDTELCSSARTLSYQR